VVSVTVIRPLERAMSIPDQFPRRMSRVVPAAAAPSGSVAGDGTADASDVAPAQRSWPWQRAALLASIAAQLITISALVSADPIPATWTALLLGVAPVPLALLVAFAPAPVARLAAPLAVVVLVVGMIGQVTHTAVFFLPALAFMIVAALRLWREGA
jgi:hypothetical protein